MGCPHLDIDCEDCAVSYPVDFDDCIYASPDAMSAEQYVATNPDRFILPAPQDSKDALLRGIRSDVDDLLAQVRTMQERFDRVIAGIVKDAQGGEL